MPSVELDNLVRIGKLVWRVLAKAHERRNRSEYEGYLERDERLLVDLITAANRLSDALSALADNGVP